MSAVKIRTNIGAFSKPKKCSAADIEELFTLHGDIVHFFVEGHDYEILILSFSHVFYFNIFHSIFVPSPPLLMCREIADEIDQQITNERVLLILVKFRQRRSKTLSSEC